MQAFFEKLFPGDRSGGPTVLWVLGNTAIYYTISAILLFMTMWIPCGDTGKPIAPKNFI
jgi:hypothetical protein